MAFRPAGGDAMASGTWLREDLHGRRLAKRIVGEVQLRRRSVILIAVALSSLVAGFMPNVPPAQAAVCDIKGDTYYGLGRSGAGCHKHHILSAKSLRDTRPIHRLGRYSAPAIRMHASDHINCTPNWGSGPDAKKDRAQEVAEIGFDTVHAFDEAAKRLVEMLEECEALGIFGRGSRDLQGADRTSQEGASSKAGGTRTSSATGR